MRIFLKTIQIAIAIFLLASCASSVQKISTEYQYQGEKFSTAAIMVTPEMLEKLRDTDFSADEMIEVLIRQLRSRQLLDENAPYSLQVYIDDIRLRSLLNAMAFAFFAGDDHIKGDVSVLDANQNPIGTYRVSTSFAMGGVFGREGDVRWEWLYNKFAQQIIAGLLQDQQ